MTDRTIANMTRIPGRRFLHSPGPTHLPDEVLDAMHRQPMDLADPRVSDNVVACERGLRRLIDSEQAEIVMYAANGHGAWEVAIENLLAPGAAALIPGTGHFSDSWAVQCEALGRRALRTPWREGHPIDPQAVEDALRADTAREIAAVFVVQTDTASGVTSDIDLLRAALDASGHPALFVVDAVASLGAMPLRFDAQRIDVLVGASQKGLMLPPGIGFVAVGPAAAEFSRRNPAPRFYWDWTARMGEQPYRKFCGTPPLNLLFGMEAGLKLLFAEGIDAVWERHRLLSSLVHAAVQAWSEQGALGFLCQVPAARSVSVTAIEVRRGIDPEAIRALARERFQVSIAGGLGPLAGRVFRIGHLGDLNAPMILGALASVEAALLASGVPIGRDGLRRALDLLASSQAPAFSALATSGTSAGPR